MLKFREGTCWLVSVKFWYYKELERPSCLSMSVNVFLKGAFRHFITETTIVALTALIEPSCGAAIIVNNSQIFRKKTNDIESDVWNQKRLFYSVFPSENNLDKVNYVGIS